MNGPRPDGPIVQDDLFAVAVPPSRCERRTMWDEVAA